MTLPLTFTSVKGKNWFLTFFMQVYINRLDSFLTWSKIRMEVKTEFEREVFSN